MKNVLLQFSFSDEEVPRHGWLKAIISTNIWLKAFFLFPFGSASEQFSLNKFSIKPWQTLSVLDLFFQVFVYQMHYVSCYLNYHFFYFSWIFMSKWAKMNYNHLWAAKTTTTLDQGDGQVITRVSSQHETGRED